jgi:hypothetical protein
MSTEPVSDAESTTRLSWKERELVTALRRLANARSQVTQLEEAMAGPTLPSPADMARIRELEAELEPLRRKAQSRFGGGGARERLAEVEAEQNRLLEAAGFASLDELDRAAAESSSDGHEGDPVLLEFARRELSDAETALQEVLALPDEEVIEEEPPVVDLRSD